MEAQAARKPRWLVKPLPRGAEAEAVARTAAALRAEGLHTVCEEARCPNRSECWSHGEATIMILGDVCTRGCRFCDVSAGHPGAPDLFEPLRTARTVKVLGLRYAVITSVDRDDLADQGAEHWARTIRAVRRECPETILDVLTPDFRGERALIRQVVEAGPHVLAHNLETVSRLQRRVRDARAGYEQSLAVLRAFREDGARWTKSALMLGLGEEREEVHQALRDLREAGVDFVTLGQYLQPRAEALPVARWVPPEEFADLETVARDLGFRHVASGPFVRSSYRAWEVEAIVRA